MKKLILFTAVIFMMGSSCHYMGGKRVRGNGRTSTEQRSISGFTTVETHGSIDIIVSQGAYKTEVECDENLLQYIETSVDNGRLLVHFRDGLWLTHYNNAKVHVTAPVLNGFEIHGSGNISSEGKITESNKMKMIISGSGDIKLDVDCPDIETETHGSGNITLAGESKNISSYISGSGDVRAGNLKAENAKAAVHGSGDTDVFASVSLDVQIFGSGDVRYKGSPKVNTEIHGSGSVNKID
jgi:Putative auto-transporter adhesin, head GIN domain